MTQIADALTVEGALTAAGGVASGTVLTSPVINGGAVINGGTAQTTIHGAAMVLIVPVSAVSAAATAFTLAVPAGGTVLAYGVEFFTTTAFTGATVSGTLGSAASDASYIAATSVKAAGITSLAVTSNSATANALTSVTSGGLVFTLEQGTPTAVGSGTLVVPYVLP